MEFHVISFLLGIAAGLVVFGALFFVLGVCLGLCRFISVR